jgi:hypothetical protein
VANGKTEVIICTSTIKAPLNPFVVDKNQTNETGDPICLGTDSKEKLNLSDIAIKDLDATDPTQPNSTNVGITITNP